MLVCLQSSICNSTKAIKVQELLLKTIPMYRDVAKLGNITTTLFLKSLFKFKNKKQKVISFHRGLQQIGKHPCLKNFIQTSAT